MDYDFFDGYDEEAFDDELMFDDEYESEWEKSPNGAKKPISKKKKKVAEDAVKAIVLSTAKAQGIPPAAAKSKAVKQAKLAVTKVEQELYEGYYEDEFEDEFEAEDGFDPELLEEMEELAELAAESYDEEEADEFLGALGALAAKAAPFLVKAAPGIISSLMGEEEYGEYEYEDDLYEDGDEFLGAIAGLASSVLPKVVKGVGRVLRSRGARNVIRRLPRAIMGATRRTMRSGVPTPGNFARHLGVSTARAVLNPVFGRRRRRRPRRYPTMRYRKVCRRVPIRRYRYR